MSLRVEGAYHPLRYWRARGETAADAYDPSLFADQEVVLLEVLEGLQYGSVLDVGCGFGRVARLVDIRAAYSGIDISGDVLDAARLVRPDGRFVRAAIRDFRPSHDYDLVMAIEVLMHIRPREIWHAMARLMELSRRYVLTLDWTEAIPEPAALHNFRHDYSAIWPKLLGPKDTLTTRTIGLQTLYLVERWRY